ncbi:MAG: hypothetical protein R2813_03575 [Flavobacteriales bacterium]
MKAISIKANISYEYALSVALLDILSIAPILMILGNVIPPFVLKVHQVGFGLALLLAVGVLTMQSRTQVFLAVAAIFLVVQSLYAQHVDPIESFDFLFGPIALLAIIVILERGIVSREVLRSRRKLFFLLCMVPISIGILQYFHIVPVTFLNAQYINYYYEGSLKLERINGFFYHGNELVVLSYFFFLNMAYGKSKERAMFWMLSFFLFALALRYKSLWLTAGIIVSYYVVTISKFGGRLLKTIPKWGYWAAGLALLTTTAWLLVGYVHENLAKYGLPFKRELFTGRGGIWAVYLEAVFQFRWYEHLIGGGLGSEFQLFGDHMSAKAFYPYQVNPNTTVRPHPHNPWIGYYVNAGLCGILLLIYILRQWLNSFRKLQGSVLEKAFSFIVIVLPFLTFGVTIYITDMAIYWLCLGFTLINVQYKSVLMEL